MTMECSRDERLQADKMEVLYGEADTDARSRLETHLAACPACREEMAALRRLRGDLGAWRVGESRRPVFTAPRRTVPGWLAGAAVMVLAAGAALGLSGSEAGFEDGRPFLRLGRIAALRGALDAQEARALARARRHEEEIAALRSALDSAQRYPDREALLAHVDARVEEAARRSEERQAEELRDALTEWTVRVEAQRRIDLARVAAGLSYLDGRQGRQLARTNELMGFVIEAASQRK